MARQTDVDENVLHRERKMKRWGFVASLHLKKKNNNNRIHLEKKKSLLKQTSAASSVSVLSAGLFIAM